VADAALAGPFNAVAAVPSAFDRAGQIFPAGWKEFGRDVGVDGGEHVVPALRGKPAVPVAAQLKVYGVIGMGSFGTSVATETCGQVSPLKFRKTVCVYWICVYVTSIWVSAVISVAGLTAKLATGLPALALPRTITDWPGPQAGTVIFSETVSIQNIAVIRIALAFGAVAALSPSRNAMLSVPPPKSGSSGSVLIMITVVEVMFCASARFL
jgi:hypothetical protein